MILWWWHFLAMWGTTQKASRNCALFELCGKVGPPQPCKLWKQRCCCAAGRAPPLAAAISGASLTHQSFVNNHTRLLQREKIKAQFPLSLHFRYFASGLMLRWMIDEEYTSGRVFLTNNFDNIWQNYFQKFLAPDNDAKTNRQWGRSIILEEIGLQYFSHTQRVLGKKLCLIEV